MGDTDCKHCDGTGEVKSGTALLYDDDEPLVFTVPCPECGARSETETHDG